MQASRRVEYRVGGFDSEYRNLTLTPEGFHDKFGPVLARLAPEMGHKSIRAPTVTLPVVADFCMHRQAMFSLQQRPQRFYAGDEQMILGGAGLSDEDSFGGENSHINEVSRF